MLATPDTVQALFQLLTTRHALMMDHRMEKRPGVFKEKPNKAGDTLFVTPEELQGTLAQGLEIGQQLSAGLKKAIFMQFLVSECHPFDDGNGRLSRIMMNAEMHSAGLHKLIMPTVHRDSYLNGLRQASQQGKFRALTKVFHQMHLYTASMINWQEYGEAWQAMVLIKFLMSG
nr:Fic family protein [Endozoicomonas sp. ONNA2]